jgi:hypothetical protein
MFQGRVMGVGIVLPKELGFEDTISIGKFEMDQANAQNEYNRKLTAWTVGLNAARSQCPPIDPNIRYIQPPICQAIEDYKRSNPMPVKGSSIPTPTPVPTPSPTGSALPLLLGAAYLLLS